MILTPLQKLPYNVVDLGKIFVATGFEWLPKVKKSPNLVTLMMGRRSVNSDVLYDSVWQRTFIFRGNITVRVVTSLTGWDSEASQHTKSNTFACLLEPNPVKLETTYTVVIPPTSSILSKGF